MGGEEQNSEEDMKKKVLMEKGKGATCHNWCLGRFDGHGSCRLEFYHSWNRLLLGERRQEYQSGIKLDVRQSQIEFNIIPSRISSVYINQYVNIQTSDTSKKRG